MSAIMILIPLSILIATSFLACFIWAVRSGQYEDTCTPSLRMLTDEPDLPPTKNRSLASPNSDLKP